MTIYRTAQQPWLLIFISTAAIWGSSFLFMRVAALEMGAWSTACLRMVIGSLIMLPLLAWKGLLGQLWDNRWMILKISLVNAAIPFACFAFAVLHITTGLSAILNATTPMFTAIVAWVWFEQRLSTARMVGIALGFMGVALLVGEQADVKGADAWLSVASMFACLVATLCYAVSGNVIKQKMAHMHPWAMSGGTMLGAALWLCVPAYLTWPTQSVSDQAWGALLVAGAVCSAAAFMLYFELMKRTDITRTASVTYLIPVFAIFYSVLFLDEPVTLWMLFCGLVVVMGTAFATGWLIRRPI